MSESLDTGLPEDEGLSLLDILQTLAKNARLLVLGPLIVALVALGVSFLFKPIYVASTSIMTPQQQGGAAAALAQLGTLAGVASSAAGLRNPADMYIGLLQSRSIADRIIDRFKMMDTPGMKTREDARKLLARITDMMARRDGQITIEVTSYLPALSAAVANAYVEELSALTARLAVTEAQQRRQFYQMEMEKAKDNLARAEIALRKTGVSESVLKFNPMAMGEGLAALKAKIAAKEVQLASMRGYLTENSPDFRMAQQELAALRAQVAKLDQAPPTGGNADYINRYRDFKYYETLFDQLAKQYELAKIDESSEGAFIQVVDVAIPPEKKANLSKVVVVFIAWLGAGIVLVLYVFVRHALNNAGEDPKTATKLAAIRTGFRRVLKPWT